MAPSIRPLAGALALGLALTAAAASRPAPSADLVKRACSDGLLVRGSEDSTRFDDAAARDYPDLFGADDGDGADDAKDGKKKAPPKRAKPKARLLRPRAKDPKDCAARFGAFYSDLGGDVDAVPAPALPTEELAGRADRVFEQIAGPAGTSRLAALTDGDLKTRSAAVAAMFDGVRTLSDAGFEQVGRNVQALAAAKSARVAAGALVPDARPDADPPPPAPATPPPAPPRPGPDVEAAPAEALTPTMRRRWSPDRPIAPRYTPPPVGTYEPPAGQERPSARSWANTYVPDAVWTYGGKIADRVWGGGDPSVNVELPTDPHAPPWYKEVRFGRYGTAAMIAGLQAVGADMASMHSPTLLIGDISQRGGGTLRRHLSHKIGKDVDVFFITDARGRFDVPWNLMLAASAVKNMNVTRIFVDDGLKSLMAGYLASSAQIPPQERANMQKALSRMQYWPGHDTHFHIRIDY